MWSYRAQWKVFYSSDGDRRCREKYCSRILGLEEFPMHTISTDLEPGVEVYPGTKLYCIMAGSTALLLTWDFGRHKLLAKYQRKRRQRYEV